MVTRLTERYAGSTGAMSSGEKAFYYIAPDDGEVTFTLSRSSIDLDLFLVVNDDLGDFLQSASTSNTGEPTVSLLIPVTRGQKLYIIVQQDIGEGRYVLSSKLVKKEKSFDLGITEITTTSVEPFNTGENVRFKVEVNNYRDEQSPAYKVVVYDSNGRLLDSDTNVQLSENDYDYAYLDVIMDSSGSHELMFAIEVDGYTDIDPNDNTEYITYEWIGTSDSFNLAITEITTTSVPPFNTDENVRFTVKVEKFNKISAAYKVVVYDSNGNLLDSDTKVQLAQYNHANLAVKMNSSGFHQLTFAIETDDDDDTSDNTKCETYEWIRNSNSFNLAITEITTTSVPPFNTGDDITFNVKVEKFNKLSAAYKVVVYDSNGNLLDSDTKVQLAQYNDAHLTVKMDSIGFHQLTFAIETDDVDDTSDNTKCETYQWTQNSNSFNLAITEITTTSVPPFNTGENITFNVKVENFNSEKKSPAYNVVVYDSNDRLLDSDSEPQISEYDHAQLTVRMDSSGSHELRFAIEVDGYTDTDPSDNIKVKTYEWQTTDTGDTNGIAGNKASANIIYFIKKSEGFAPSRYLCPAGKVTMGYGMVDAEISGLPDVITEQTATQLLTKYVNDNYYSEVLNILKNSGINNPLQREVDAFTSFAYNFGTGAFQDSTLLEVYKSGERGEKIHDQLKRWVHAKDKDTGETVVLPGLVTRRENEWKIFSGSTEPVEGYNCPPSIGYIDRNGVTTSKVVAENNGYGASPY